MLFPLANKTEDPDDNCKKFEEWLEKVTQRSDLFIAAARVYSDAFGDKKIADQNTSHHSKTSSYLPSSERSSQRKRDLNV